MSDDYTFDLAFDFLDETEADRLYRDHPSLGRDPAKYCPTCYTAKTYVWRGETVACDCQRQLQLHKHYLAAGIGVNYQRLSWGDYEGDPALKRALDKYLERHQAFVGQGVGLLLHGEYGTGKTFGATMLLKDLMKRGYVCYATTFASMIEMFTSGWKSKEDQRYFQQKIMLSNVLLLDDLGRELRTKNKLSESTFDDVLRRRVQDGRPTFITTNMSVGELNEGYGGAVLSLLTEKSMVYELRGSDFRPQANSRMMDEMMAGETRPIF